eukprot:gene27120-2348_t
MTFLLPDFRLPIDANDLLPLADGPNAEETTKQALSARPKSLCAQRFNNKNTLLHELALLGNLPLLRGAVDAARESWETLQKKPKSAASKSKFFHIFSIAATSVETGDPVSDSAEIQRLTVQHFLDAKNDLNQGADPWIQDRCGSLTALHHAAMKSSAECIEAIMNRLQPEFQEHQLSIGMYINCRSAYRATPLLYAVAYENVAAMQALLAYGPDIVASTSSVCYDGGLRRFCLRTTPLHVAAELGQMDVAIRLLKHYAWRMLTGGSEEDDSQKWDPRVVQNAEGKTAFSLAANSRCPNMETRENLFVLLSSGTELNTIFSPEELVADHLGVQRLAILAAAALKAKLVNELEACSPDLGWQLQTALSLRSVCSMTSDSGKCCGICFDCPVEVEISKIHGRGCAHQLCHTCASKLLPTSMETPALCPYCRQAVPGFIVYEPKQ